MVKRLAAVFAALVAFTIVASSAHALGIDESRKARADAARREGGLGDEALNAKDWDKAIEHYTKYLDAKACSDQCGKFYYKRGLAYQQKQDCEHALADYLEAEKTVTDNGELYWNASLCFSQQKQEDKALEQLNLAIKVNPESNNYHVGRCIILFNRHDFAGALQDCEYTLGSAPDDQGMLYATAMSAEQTGDKAKAAKYYKHLHDLNPGDQRATDGLKRVGG